MAAVAFPDLVPTRREYEPGIFPEVQFQSQNGAVVRVRYGNQRSKSKLSLTFENISDYNASLILQNYYQVMVDDNHITFGITDGAAGLGTELQPWIRETNGELKWKYEGAPALSSVRPGLSTISCRFVGELEGA